MEVVESKYAFLVFSLCEKQNTRLFHLYVCNVHMHVNQDKYICVYIQMYLCMPLVGLHTYVYKESVK